MADADERGGERSTPGTSSISSRAAWLLGAAVLLVAVAARSSRLLSLFVGDAVVALDGDSVRHLARMQQAVRDGLRVPAFDPLVNWPHGAFEPWAPGFDLVGALLMAPFGAEGVAGPLAASVLPLLLGVGVVALTALVAGRLGLPPLAAWGTALVVALSPQAVVSTMVGRTDHHAWEACSLLALAAWTLWETDARRFELVGGGLLFVALWGFDGAPLYVALVAGALALRVAFTERPAFMGSGVFALALAAAATGLAYLPVVLQHGAWLTFKRPSLLQPALVAVAGLGLGGVVLASRGTSSLVQRAVRSTLLALVPLLVAALIGPLRTQVQAGLEEWLARSDPWLASVAEFEPMLGAPLGFERLTASFGRWALATPVLFPLGLLLALRAGKARVAPWVLLAVGVAALTLAQMRFGRVAIPFVVIACAIALFELCRRWRPEVVTAAACALAALADPRAVGYLVPSEPTFPKPIAELSLALRALAPEHGGRGVLSTWEDGHYVEALGGHPVLVNGFGTYSSPEGYELTRTFWTGTPESLDALLAARRLGWWIDGAQNFFTRKDGDRALFGERDGRRVLEGKTVRDWPLAASVFGGSGDVRRRVPHLSRFWPRAASTASSLELGVKLPDLWLFEHVEGAVLAGQASPGAVASATLTLSGRWPYTAWTVADERGAFELRLPIPTSVTRGLETGPSWRVTVDGSTRELPVSEAAVRRGERLAW